MSYPQPEAALFRQGPIINGTAAYPIISAAGQRAGQLVDDAAPALAGALSTLRQDAAAALAAGPFTITAKQAVPPSGDKRDFLSLGSYWWPNPATADGLPYVRRDGHYNPEGDKLDRPTMEALVANVISLCLASRFLDEPNNSYAQRALELVRVFFLDTQTGMRPHLDYAQAIPGKCEGRDIGVIDTACLAIQLLPALSLLHGSPHWSSTEHAALRQWFATYLGWLLESPNGQSEATKSNNHGTAYDLQAVSFALFVGRTDLAELILAGVPARRFATQIEPDGSQPHELTRTRALSYSTMNTNLMLRLVLLAKNLGAEPHQFGSIGAADVRQAVEWLTPYWLEERPWTYQQIVPFGKPAALNCLRLAAWIYDDASYERTAARLIALEPALLQNPANLLLPPH